MKLYIKTLYFAIRDPRVPWYARLLGFMTVAYAMSPIDLIPDFIPVIGYLDDYIILPAAIFAMVRMIPKDIFRESLLKASRLKSGSMEGIIAAVIIASLWIAVLLWLGKVFYGYVK